MKVLFLGDSLGFPRPDRSILDDQTWCHLVKKNMKSHPEFDFFFYMNGGAHTKSLLSHRKGGYLAAYDPNIVILQVGIVDSASRALEERTLKFISSIPIVSQIVRKFIKKFHRQLLSIRNIHYVYPDEFRSNLQELKKSFGEVRFIVIPITPATKDYIHFMPRIKENIPKYNKILNEVFPGDVINEVYERNAPEEVLLDDNHHLSELGHKLVAEMVTSKLK